MRSRAALLPYPGDPFLLNYWLHFFVTIWGKEVDALYIGFNSPIEQPVFNYVARIAGIASERTGKNIVIDYQDHMADHGPTINRLLELCTEKYVMLIEDDGFIFKGGMVDNCFSLLENGSNDIVGSKRGSCHDEILIASQQKYGISYTGEGDQGPNFWPNFFFSSKELLMKTDRNFAAKAWNKGTYIEELDHTVQAPVIYGDTFVNTSIQLRAMVPIERIAIVPQYHGSPDDLEHAAKGLYLFDGRAPWTHIGSLSSGVGGVLRDAHNRPLARRLIDPEGGKTMLDQSWCAGEGGRREWERRVQWWKMFYEWAAGDLLEEPGMQEFYTLYGQAVETVIDQYALDRGNIRMRQKMYRLHFGL